MALKPNESFSLDKSVWTEADFDHMGWHDMSIHSLAFSGETSELLMDIDYAFAWVDPPTEGGYFSFWLAPCTLVFSNVHSFTAQIEWGLGFNIQHVSRKLVPPPEGAAPSPPQWQWEFDCLEGTFSFQASGYQQITRKSPVHSKAMDFSWEERGGISFDRTPFAI